ncbi:aldehyde dehydrogenase [Jeotgalicoccus coquinae]|uniref:Aldehyde dehydrogenase n=1 Tax=Jeotgalicoccus coquinae TaxID=709509 RepID=A0A6V7R2J8_9STAP|nr:aldehyde dehydrogenase [Jeotgalicoccus coquinae]MBB6423507.1 aldehyde dehydrogenase (NAD+) [Jeotgalicoccus coquinae]GGE20362.1 aldehyde dehydrogenase [Jeotgalicoccus coquinae]CAD2071569.1 Aldehyde dehydrogenase [Jeotgalicoccus coquinae]
MSIQSKVEKQREYFYKNHTKSVSFRIRQLKKLKSAIQTNEKMILEAVYKDLGKSKAEAYMTELGIVYKEFDYVIKNLRSWSSPEKVSGSMMSFPAKNYIYRDPYGVVLILSPWNYPFNLTMMPLIGAIAGGNCAIVKPSETSPHTAAIIEKILNYTFSDEYVYCAPADTPHDEVNEQQYDYIFFTGSTNVGKEIMSIASKTLTPVTLELGGKSPAVVDETANIDVAVKRIAWGKFVNAGQTCVAPDHVIIHSSKKQEFIDRMLAEIEERYSNAVHRDDYPKIINEKHFKRLSGLLENEMVLGGSLNAHEQKIAPALIPDSTFDSPSMEEEIFGPILPIITYDNLQDLIVHQQTLPKPLAFYIFSENERNTDTLLSRLSFGGGCVNDTLMHLSHHDMPFGGVGASGMGHYHGKYSFDTFTHKKSVVKNSTAIDIPVRYAPFNEAKTKLFRKFLS